MESIFITVGKNSLLPIQIKTCHKDGDYDLFIFDYEAPREPPEFFDAPAIELPDASGEFVVDGDTIEMPITGSPDMKTAIVRLRSNPSDAEKIFVDITFVTDAGYHSSTNKRLALRVDEAAQCGTGSEAGGLDKWPDGKFRNVRFSPWLRPTDKPDTYIVEIRCRIKSKDE